MVVCSPSKKIIFPFVLLTFCFSHEKNLDVKENNNEDDNVLLYVLVSCVC